MRGLCRGEDPSDELWPAVGLRRSGAPGERGAAGPRARPRQTPESPRYETAAIGGDIRLKGGKDLDVEVASAARLRVGGDAHFTARGAHYVEVRGDHHASTGGSLEHKVAGTVALESAQAFHVTAPMIVLEASAGLTLKGPGGFVTIDASGVSVQGTLVKLNSGGAALPVQSPAPRAPEPPRCPTPSAPTPAEGDER